MKYLILTILCWTLAMIADSVGESGVALTILCWTLAMIADSVGELGVAIILLILWFVSFVIFLTAKLK